MREGSTTRRGFAGAAVGLAALSGFTTSAQATPSNPPTFVLVHGAWRGGWVWERVAKRLRMAGAQVYAPTLTGLAERSHLLRDDINLNTHIDDVVGEMKWKDLSNVVLVGHSYAGMVITGVAEREAGRLSSIVYLDAFLPESDQSLRDITGTKSAPTNGPMTAIPAVQMVNAKDAPWVQSKLTPQPGGTFSQAVKSTGAIYSLPKRTYIQALIGASPWFTKAYQKCAEEPRWQTHQLNCLHDAMLDLPDELTAMLLTTV